MFFSSPYSSLCHKALFYQFLLGRFFLPGNFLFWLWNNGFAAQAGLTLPRALDRWWPIGRSSTTRESTAKLLLRVTLYFSALFYSHRAEVWPGHTYQPPHWDMSLNIFQILCSFADMQIPGSLASLLSVLKVNTKI